MISVETEDPASFVTPVVLAITDNSAPGLGLVDTDASFDGKAIQGEFSGRFLGENEVLLVVENEVSVGIKPGCFAGFERLIFNRGFVRAPFGDHFRGGGRETQEGEIKRFHAGTGEMNGGDYFLRQ